jgi:cell fate (sporulation/competence/biofilm development) regulator YlbF (YheA/YmcA/DUF963 family)
MVLCSREVCFLRRVVVYYLATRAEAEMPAYCFETKLIMHTTTEETTVMQKTRELCQTILDQPNMQSIRQRIDAFMGDEKTRSQYDNLVNKGQELQQKQQNAVALSGNEISDFEQSRDALMKNPVARNFMDAQEELHQVQQSVHQYVNKTLELGRLPTEEEMSGGSCGHGCGCGHGHSH